MDIGVHQDGLVHISDMADRFVKNPADVVSVHQKVKVTVMDVDMERKRISLSMKSVPGEGSQKAAPVKKGRGKKRQKRISRLIIPLQKLSEATDNSGV